MPQVFGITATYATADGRQFSEKTTIDLRVFQKSAVVKDPVVEQLEKIDQSLKGLRK